MNGRGRLIVLLISLGWLFLLPKPPAEAAPVLSSSSFDWQALETAHFVIVFPKELMSLAPEAAQIAERAHDYWTKELQYVPSDRVYVVLLDQSDVTRVSWSLLPHPVLWIDHPFGWSGDLWRSPRASWLEDLLVSEYGRIVDQTRSEGITAKVRAVLGMVIAPGVLKPHWLQEGIALLASLDHNFEEMVLRAMVESKGFPSLAQLSSPYESQAWPSAKVQAQTVGWTFLQYILETYGPDVLNKIGQMYATNPLISVTLGALPLVTGQPLLDTYQGFQAWAEQRFVRIQREIEAQGGITSSTRLTSLGFVSADPAWSPSGDALVYNHSDPQRLSGLRWIRSDGTGDQALLACECGPAGWLDEFTLIYPKLELEGDSASYDLYRLDLKSRSEERLTYGERIYAVKPFPDGHRMLIARNEENGKSALVVLDLRDRSRYIVKEFEADHRVHSMAISPDGELIALSLWTKMQNQDIDILSSQGGDLVSLTNDPALDFNPVFSGDGSSILFSSNRDGLFNLYALRLGDRQLFRVTQSLTGSFDPAISSDGQGIVFVRYESDGFSLHLLEYEPSHWHTIPRSQSDEDHVFTATSSTPTEKTQSFQIAPYDPAPALIPTFWLPLVGPRHIGLFTQNEDPIGWHRYELSAGMELDSHELFYEIRYTLARYSPWIQLRLQGSPSDARQEISLEFPFSQSTSHERILTLGLTQERGRTQLFLKGDLADVRGLDLFHRRSSLSMMGSLGWLPQGPNRRLTIDWGEELQLPWESSSGAQQFAFQARAAWADHEEFRLGGVSGEYPLRGFEGTTMGTELLMVGAEYRFPIWSIDSGCCGESAWPLFLDNLRGSVFLEMGAAGAALELERLQVSLGLELQLKLIWSYGLTEGWLRAGFAYGLGTKQPQLYFALSPRF